ncbi:MAG: class I SAM-dependent RNA methyltransferase [Candidatus Omnitrophica bacterium]|nr:class I SAM-dependent RNA methyltransferase [Candidatus Omnitrophota bacterium]
MELSIEKLVFGGQGLAKKDGKTYLVWNALPGETVRVKVVKKAHSVYEAIAEEVLTPSPDRVEAIETHSLSCSPWQILKFEAENAWKQKIAQETYERLGDLKNSAPIPIVSNAAQQTGYRNKIEYSFSSSPKGLSLAFFERDSHTKQAIPFCCLADDAIQKRTDHILDWLKKEGPHERCLKSLVIRSDSQGRSIAGLFLEEAVGIKTHPALNESLTGFHIYAAKKPILEAGEKSLTTSLNGTALTFGLFSFFQINTPLFEKALLDMAGHLEPSSKLVDFYSGVGAIGISLKKHVESAILVESHAEAAAYAKANIKRHHLKNYEAILSETETITRLITSDSTVIFDPPRAGLHSRVLRKILAEKPIRILYLSCDIATHARDIKALSGAYKLKDLKLYNFFPRTPHIESLAVLEQI